MLDVISQLVSNLSLQAFNAFRMKLNHLTSIQINQMIMMLAVSIFKSGWPTLKCMAMDSAQSFQQFHGTINRCKRERSVNLHCAFENLHGVRMIIRLRQYGKNGSARFGNANPCLAPDAGFMAAAAQAGLSEQDVIRHILLATGHYPASPPHEESLA